MNGEIRTGSKAPLVLSSIIIVLMVLASGGGLFMEGIYRDNLLVRSGWLGNDLVTLALAVPLLTVSLVLATRGSTRASLVWMGMLFYVLYNYAFYLFGAAFNSLFLVYVGLFTLSIFAITFGLINLDARGIAGQFRPGTPVKAVAGFMIAVALLLGGFHTFLSLGYVLTGQVPEIVTNVEHPTNLVSALDLSLVVSVGFLAAVWLWRSQPWGFILAVIWNVNGFVYMTALSGATVRVFQAGASESMAQLALWGPIGAGCLICSALLLAHMGVSAPQVQ